MSEKRVWSSLSPSDSLTSTEKRACTDDAGDSFLYDESTITDDHLSSTHVDGSGDDVLSQRNTIRDEVRAALLDKDVLLRIADVVGSVLSKRLGQQILDLKEEIKKKDKKIEDLTYKVDELEQYTRRNSVRVAGVPEQREENVDEVATSVFKAMGVDLPVSAIDRCHRIGRPNLSSPTSPRSIIVKLVSYRDKAAVMRSRKKLKDKKAKDMVKTRDGGDNRVFINEDLTATRAKLAAEARRLKRDRKIEDTWTKDGVIFIKKDNSISRITNSNDMLSV